MIASFLPESDMNRQLAENQTLNLKITLIYSKSNFNYYPDRQYIQGKIKPGNLKFFQVTRPVLVPHEKTFIALI